ncbi:MAG: phage tail sheath C-terminal domain-containing protein [Bacteroidota bacterium]
MAATLKTPGVYIEEIAKLPSSVAEVETAIPAFLGFTENGNYKGQPLLNKPVRIKSLLNYEEIFGFPKQTNFHNFTDIGNPDGYVKIKETAVGSGVYVLDGDNIHDPAPDLKFRLYYCLQMYFANGGGPCYIVSCGTYTTYDPITAKKVLNDALDALRKEDEPTMIVFCDAAVLSETDQYGLYQLALKQAADLMDRVVILDTPKATALDGLEAFRSGVGNNSLSYGAAYFPWLQTTLGYYADEVRYKIKAGTTDWYLRNDDPACQDHSLFHKCNQLYNEIKKQAGAFRLVLPPASSIAGVYATVDNSRGVWKSPANVSLAYVTEPMVRIDESDQEDMNVTGTGKSINAIRTFTGKGVLVWGARTLAGNDNEWKYVSVRRFYNMVEESVKKASEPFVFEPNDANTWIKVRAMIENYLTLKWRDGAMMGAKPGDAFFVKVGLGETMTALDILEGRMIIEIGMAVVRPAEFIILRFSHKMAVS